MTRPLESTHEFCPHQGKRTRSISVKRDDFVYLETQCGCGFVLGRVLLGDIQEKADLAGQSVEGYLGL